MTNQHEGIHRAEWGRDMRHRQVEALQSLVLFHPGGIYYSSLRLERQGGEKPPREASVVTLALHEHSANLHCLKAIHILCSVPTCSTWPFINDTVITTTNVKILSKMLLKLSLSKYF